MQLVGLITNQDPGAASMVQAADTFTFGCSSKNQCNQLSRWQQVHSLTFAARAPDCTSGRTALYALVRLSCTAPSRCSAQGMFQSQRMRSTSKSVQMD